MKEKKRFNSIRINNKTYNEIKVICENNMIKISQLIEAIIFEKIEIKKGKIIINHDTDENNKY